MNTGVSKSINLKNACFSIQPSVASEDFFDGKIKSTENFNIISVGRFVPLKGFDLTLLSFIKFIHTLPTQERKNSKLTLVGTGPEKELYIKIIKENDAANYIEIIEWIDRKELMKLYKEASIFLFPSHEGAGMVVAEALSFGLPVLCLNNEGPGEFITQECGFIVNQLDYFNTVSQLKNAILNLYSDRNLLFKMSINARKHYEENFTWNSRGNHLKEIYNKL
jgi:glycosyltransferase involved in cell wall biosynthesis